ncbi:unnamed protein product [Danaus chrysippus]|uniref:(African queen) hypothetical protein n=1 Tax=Danaus chrysippus TaxID=151541 RepID=A0A8J2RCP0_9NEOP|nr:unnamed protein product [Danaus chrysippus]
MEGLGRLREVTSPVCSDVTSQDAITCCCVAGDRWPVAGGSWPNTKVVCSVARAPYLRRESSSAHASAAHTTNTL